MNRPRTLWSFGIVAILVLGAHATFLPRKIRRSEPETYERYAVDLKVSAARRIGYLSGIHGAVLVWIPNSGTPPALATRSPRSEELRAFMSRELERIPLKFIGEGLFYLGLLALTFFAAPRLAGLARRFRSRPLRAAASVAPGALLFVLAAAPLLIAGYGYGGFTNLAGPNAMSYSGPYFHLQSWLNNSSNSISYRAFASPLLLPPGILVDLFWLALQRLPVYGPLLDSEPRCTALYWIAGALFYGLAGAALGLTIRRFRRGEPSI